MAPFIRAFCIIMLLLSSGTAASAQHQFRAGLNFAPANAKSLEAVSGYSVYPFFSVTAELGYTGKSKYPYNTDPAQGNILGRRDQNYQPGAGSGHPSELLGHMQGFLSLKYRFSN